MENIIGKATKANDQEAQHWMSVSDLMAGLMMVFLFISIALMRSALIERDKIKEVAVTYSETQVAIFEALEAEFSEDLDQWDAEIQRDTLEFRFKSPEVLFDIGSTDLKPKFKQILSDFFPRYVDVLRPYRDSITEVKIEGHTSSVWNDFTSRDEAYFKNMTLSQGRTREVLQFVYGIEGPEDKNWARGHLAAVGYSSARLVHDASGVEDKERSRRVAFRVESNAEMQIRKILEF